MPDYDPDELLAIVIEAVAENLSGDDAEVLELPVAVLLDQPGSRN